MNTSLSFVALAGAIAARADAGKPHAADAQAEIASKVARCRQRYSDVRDALGACHARARSEERFDGGADADNVLNFLRESLGMQLICAMPTKHAGAIKPEFCRE